MTATERFYAGSRDDIISMDDENIYGETFTQMSFKEAIELELLTDYKVITIDIKKSEIAEFIKDNNLVQLNNKWKKETEARSLASMLALRKAMKQFNIKNAVSFHSSIEKATRSKELQKYITETYNYQPIDTYTVSGKIPTTKRNDIVQEFAKSPKALITNARCLTEGVDVPNIDCIVFADPRKSRVDIVQALGRALRKKEGKDWGYVILPVVYDEETGEIDNDNFNEILSIVRGLAANDERIIEYFKDKSLGEDSKERAGGAELFTMISETLSESDLAEQLSIKIWEKLSKFNWMPFEDARSFVHKLALKSESEWRVYIKSKNRHLNIPTSPWSVYKDRGWVDWGDWLGTGIVHWTKRSYLSHEESKKLIQSYNLKTISVFKSFIKQNSHLNIPTNPNRSYSKDWVSWGDFLGTRRISNQHKEYRSYKEALNFVHKLNLKNVNEWRAYAKSNLRPNDIPSVPYSSYKKEWQNWGVWLGTGAISDWNRAFRDFKLAKKYVRSLNLKNQKEWQAYAKSNKKPDDIPSIPDRVYKDKGWESLGDWLGASSISTIKRRFLSYEATKKYFEDNNIKSVSQWKEFKRKNNIPLEVPRNPDFVYKNNEWEGWNKFLNKQEIKYKPFDEVKDYVKKNNITNEKKWRIHCKSGEKPTDIPSAVSKIYFKYWKGWSDFLGKE